MRILRAVRGATLTGEIAYLNFYACTPNSSRDDMFWPWIEEAASELRSELERAAHQILGPAYELREMQVHRGSVEMATVLAAAGAVYVTVSQYKDLVESISLFVRQARALIRRFLQRRVPESVTVTGSWIPAPAIVPLMQHDGGAEYSRDLLFSALVWYLVATHFAMLVLLALRSL